METPGNVSPAQRAVLELVLEKGKSYEEIAETLAMPEERVREMAREAGRRLAEGADGGDDGGGSSEAEDRGSHGGTLAVFFAYLLTIVAGLTYFTIIGLSHH